MIVKTFAGSLDVLEEDVYLCNHTRFGNVFEEHIILGPLKPIIEKAGVILDIGANNGSHTLSYAFLSPKHAKIHSFEPQRKLFEKLSSTVHLNEHTMTKVKVYNTAIGDKTLDMCTLTKVDDTTVNLGGVSLGEGGEQTTMRTIDSLRLDDCDFMKIDVEGAESMVLTGARRTIETFRPVIMFEHNHCNLTPEMTPFRILTELGYRQFQYLDWSNWLTWHPENPPELPVLPCLPTRFC